MALLQTVKSNNPNKTYSNDAILLIVSAKAERDTRWQELHSYSVNSSQHYIHTVCIFTLCAFFPPSSHTSFDLLVQSPVEGMSSSSHSSVI